MENSAAAPPSVQHILKGPAHRLSRWNEEVGIRGQKKSQLERLGVV